MIDGCPYHEPAKASPAEQATDDYEEEIQYSRCKTCGYRVGAHTYGESIICGLIPPPVENAVQMMIDYHRIDAEKLAAEERAKPQGLLYAPTTGINGTPIIEALDAMEWKSVWGTKNSRRTQHFGSTYDYKRRKVGTDAPPMPDFMTPLIKHLEKFCAEQNIPCQFNQCIVNDYQVGQGINKHIDIKAYGAVIGCYTFGSGATMIFRKDGEKYELYVNPDSLYVMSGDVRNEWTHEMAGRKTDKVDGVKINRRRRVSITFRYVPE